MPESLNAERLMAHMKVLCQQIGPRQAASRQERAAAEYVKQQLAAMGITDVHEHVFDTQDSSGAITIPALGMGLAGFIIAAMGKRWAKWMGAALAFLGAYTAHGLTRAKPPFFQKWIAKHRSQNVIALIPSKGEELQHVYLIGHLDSNKQRLLTPTTPQSLFKPIATAAIGGGFLSALGLFWRGLRNRCGLSGLQTLSMLSYIGYLGMAMREENEPVIEGANDNATAVSVVLGMAEALKANPLEHTGVTLLFTGCEEVACVGIENFLQDYNPPKHNTYFIDLEMVGTGNICYITKHGISMLAEYSPAPELTAAAARAAAKHPELMICGKDMLILEEVSNLVRRGYKALCVAGFNQEGYLPNWHRVSDTLSNIEPETLSKAARYTWAIVEEIDNLAL